MASNEGGYESSVHKNNEYIADLSEATTNLAVLEQQIADNEKLLDELNKKIEEKKAGWNYNGAALQASILEQEKKIQDEKQRMEERHAWEAEQRIDSDDSEKEGERRGGQRRRLPMTKRFCSICSSRRSTMAMRSRTIKRSENCRDRRRM